MSKTRQFPLSLGARVNHREMARVDAAARIRGVNRSEYIRAATFRMVEEDLRRAAADLEVGPDQ